MGHQSNLYQSADIDFVEQVSYPRKKLILLMENIGFTENNRYFINPETSWIIEFPSGPLSVGSEPIKEIVNLEFLTGILKIISPTDCVKDRLAAFYFWNDMESLNQAIMVCKNNEIDLNEIERWSIVQRESIKFQEFKKRIVAF